MSNGLRYLLNAVKPTLRERWYLWWSGMFYSLHIHRLGARCDRAYRKSIRSR